MVCRLEFRTFPLQWKYRNFSISWSQDPRLKIFRKSSPEILSLASWDHKILKFQYFTEISVFPGPKTQDSRFSEKVSPEILSLASWDHKILKFQYFTEISVFPGPKTQDSRFSEKAPLKS